MVTETIAPPDLRQELHELIDRMPHEYCAKVRAFIDSMDMHPVDRALLVAPPEDEEISAEEEEMVRQSLADPRPSIPFEEMREELGL